MVRRGRRARPDWLRRPRIPEHRRRPRRAARCVRRTRIPARTQEPRRGRVTDRDSELFAIVDREYERQMTTVQLIASENFTSRAVLEATGSVLTNKYSEGYPGRRYYGGNYVIDEIESLAIERCKSLFGADHANV